MFQQRHYEWLAEWLAWEAMFPMSDNERDMLSHMTRRLSSCLRRDNEKFKPHKFFDKIQKDCGDLLDIPGGNSR